MTKLSILNMNWPNFCPIPCYSRVPIMYVPLLTFLHFVAVQNLFILLSNSHDLFSSITAISTNFSASYPIGKPAADIVPFLHITRGPSSPFMKIKSAGNNGNKNVRLFALLAMQMG